MSQPGVWLHHALFPTCFPSFAAALITKEVKFKVWKKPPSKPENTFGFFLEDMIVIPFLSC